MVELRQARAADIAGIVEIANWYAANTVANFAVTPEPVAMWEQAWREHHERCAWFVATNDEPRGNDGGGHGGSSAERRIVGFAKVSPFRTRCAYLWTIESTVYVRDGWHGRGIGRDLYEKVLSISRMQGYRKVIGGITLPNEASVRLHEGFGFRHVGTMPRVGWKFGQWHDVGFWELEFDGGDSREPIADIALMADVLARAAESAT